MPRPKLPNYDILLASKFGSVPAAQFVSANSTNLSVIGSIAVASPFSAVCVAQTTTTSTAGTVLSVDDGAVHGFYFRNTNAAQFNFIQSATVTSGTISANTSYVIMGQSVSGSNNSSINVSPTVGTVTGTATASVSNNFIMGTDTFTTNFVGPIGACGYLAPQGNVSNVTSNLRTIFGF